MKIQNVFILSVICFGFQVEALAPAKVACQASDGSRLIFDRFDAEPCRIRREVGGQEEVLGGVSLCLFPDDVRSDFSFWRIVPSGAKAYLVGELEAQEDGSFRGQYNLGEPETEEPWLELDCLVSAPNCRQRRKDP